MNAQRERLIPSDELIREHSGGIDRATWVSFGDYIVGSMFADVAKMGPDAKVLDVGCGCGKIARPLVDFLSPSGEYHGIDVGADCIAWCREAYAGYPNFHFHHADLYSARYNPTGVHHPARYRFPVASGAMDMVFLGSVFTHLLPDATRNYLREIARVLKPGGQVIATWFILDDDTRRAITDGRAQPPFPFAFPGKAGCRVGDPDVPEAAIAYEEQWLREAYRRARLEVFHISRGQWGREPITPHWQDEVWARRTTKRGWRWW